MAKSKQAQDDYKRASAELGAWLKSFGESQMEALTGGQSEQQTQNVQDKLPNIPEVNLPEQTIVIEPICEEETEHIVFEQKEANNIIEEVIENITDEIIESEDEEIKKYVLDENATISITHTPLVNSEYKAKIDFGGFIINVNHIYTEEQIRHIKEYFGWDVQNND